MPPSLKVFVKYGTLYSTSLRGKGGRGEEKRFEIPLLLLPRRTTMSTTGSIDHRLLRVVAPTVFSCRGSIKKTLGTPCGIMPKMASSLASAAASPWRRAGVTFRNMMVMSMMIITMAFTSEIPDSKMQGILATASARVWLSNIDHQKAKKVGTAI